MKGDTALDLGEDSRNLCGSAYAVVSALQAVFTRLPTYFAFYVGRNDALFYAPDRIYNAVLRLLAVPNTFVVYSGAHNDALWIAHADVWLRRGLDHLMPAH